MLLRVAVEVIDDVDLLLVGHVDARQALEIVEAKIGLVAQPLPDLFDLPPLDLTPRILVLLRVLVEIVHRLFAELFLKALVNLLRFHGIEISRGRRREGCPPPAVLVEVLAGARLEDSPARRLARLDCARLPLPNRALRALREGTNEKNYPATP
jgi:hypothetical protein